MDRPRYFVRQPIIDRQRDRADQRRLLLAALVVSVGVGVAGFALWQARTTRTVYVPVPMENAATPPARVVVSSGSGPAVRNWTAPPTAATFVSPRAVAAPAMPITQLPTAPAAMPTPVDYAARDRKIAELKQRIEQIDETIRRVRADPHWYGFVKNSTGTSRQQASDDYLDQLDKERNDLRRQKWTLEGR